MCRTFERLFKTCATKLFPVHSELVKIFAALGISHFGGARDPHVFQYTLRLLVSSLRLTPAGLALRFAPGETVLRSGEMRPAFARDDFFHKLSGGLCSPPLCRFSPFFDQHLHRARSGFDVSQPQQFAYVRASRPCSGAK